MEMSPVEAGKLRDLMCQDCKAEALFGFLGEKVHLGTPSRGPSGRLARKSPSLNNKSHCFLCPCYGQVLYMLLN